MRTIRETRRARRLATPRQLELALCCTYCFSGVLVGHARKEGSGDCASHCGHVTGKGLLSQQMSSGVQLVCGVGA